MILRRNARHPEKPTALPQWKTESTDNYATLKRLLPESKNERIYLYDMDYRCDPWDEPTIYDTDKPSFMIQVPNPYAQPEKTKFPSPPSPILKKTTPSPTVPVTVTSTPIDAENIICIEDKQHGHDKQDNKERTHLRPHHYHKPTPTTAMTKNHEEALECPTSLLEDLDVINDSIQHDKKDDYIPLNALPTS